MKQFILFTLFTIFFAGALNAQELTAADSASIQAEIEKYQDAPTKAAKPVTPLVPVNINTADTTALATLPGIGSKTAVKIVAYRDSLPGKRFESPGQLINVRGIGRKKLTRIWPHITL